MMTDSTTSDGGGNEETTGYEVDENTLDRAFGLLASQQRRYALEKLRETPGGVASVGDLADHLLARAPDDIDRNRVRVALHHRILPKLDDAGIIDFDSRTGTVRYHETELVEDLLEVAAARRE